MPSIERSMESRQRPVSLSESRHPHSAIRIDSIPCARFYRHHNPRYWLRLSLCDSYVGDEYS